MGIKGINSIKMTSTTSSAIKSKQSLAQLIQKVVHDGSVDPVENNSYLRDHLAFYVRTALTLSTIMRPDSKLPINVKLTGQDSYVNLDSARDNGIEIGIAHKRPPHGEKTLEERLVCQYGYLEHEISHLKFGNPEVWSEMLRFTGLSPYGGRPTADPAVFDIDNIQLIKYILNALADGHDETRTMMTNRIGFLKSIVAKDEILGNYKFDAKKAAEETKKAGMDGQLEQLLGNILMHALPNKATYQEDLSFMDDKAKNTFDKIIPHIDKGVEGTYDDLFEQSKQIYLILQKEGYLPKTSKEQQQMQQMLQQFAQNNPDAFQKMMQQGQQAGGQQGQQGQGVGAGSGMTIQLPNSRSDEVPEGGGEGNEKDKDKKGKGGGKGDKDKEDEKGDGSGSGKDKKDESGNSKGDGSEKGDSSGESGKESGQSGEGEGQGDKEQPGGTGGPGMGSTPRFVNKQEAEKGKQEALKTAHTNSTSANKQMNQLAQNNVETTPPKEYKGTKIQYPRVTVDHLRKNLELVKESQKEINKMKKLLKDRLKLGTAPKELDKQRFGRLDRKNFIRQDEIESDLIFKRKMHLPSAKARIYMIGDMSGSMRDDQIYQQAKAMTISAEAAKSLGIPVEVSFYSGAGYSDSNIYMAKTFNQKTGVISFGTDRGTIPGGGTPTSQAIDSAARRMVEDGFTSQEEQKVFYVLTDGSPDNAVAVKNKIEELGQKYKGRVKVIGVFMKSHSSDRAPAQFFQSFDTPYSEAVVVDSIDKVPDDFTKVLVDIMKKRKFR